MPPDSPPSIAQLQTRIAELEARLAEEALRQSQKMEAVGQLTGGIAHDFNNLLGSILGAVELAEQRLGQQRLADAAHMLELSRSNALRAVAQVQRLLTFSRQQTLVPQPVDVQQLVANMHDLIGSSSGPHIDFHDQTLAGQWLIRIDPQQLENALLNLCINARDAMPLGGTLSITCANTELTATAATQLGLPAGQYLHIRVTDTGMGMPSAVRQRALEPFFTTKPLGQGTGLGLSMVYGFVRQSGGQLQIDSVVGQGTCIHLYFPPEQNASASSQPVPAPACIEPSATGVRRIMLVEDQPALRLVLVELLTELGHEVQAFERGRPALEALHDGPPPDLLISGLGMPGSIDGYQLAEAYQDLVANAPMLLITGYDTADILASSYPDRRIELLRKPFDLQSLGQRVNRLLATAPSQPSTYAETPD